jgi:hypothetical protein
MTGDPDPVVVGLQRMLARLDAMKTQIDKLEGLLNQLFSRLRQIEDAQARQITELPAPPRPH